MLIIALLLISSQFCFWAEVKLAYDTIETTYKVAKYVKDVIDGYNDLIAHSNSNKQEEKTSSDDL